MTGIEKDFLSIIRFTLNPSDNIRFEGYSEIESWEELRRISISQQMWPMIYDYISALESFKIVPEQKRNLWMSEVSAAIAKMAEQTSQCVDISRKFEEQNIPYIFMKGIVCRSYYPEPELRPSSDEDIFVPVEYIEKCDKIMKDSGYQCEDDIAEAKMKKMHEIHYFKNGIMFEMHLDVIGKTNKRLLKMNSFFDDLFNNIEVLKIKYEDNVLSIYTFEPTMRLMYLISHFDKHLYNSGVGVRQMLDILLCIESIGNRIIWNKISDFLKDIDSERLFAAILLSGEKYFGIYTKSLPKKFKKTIDTEPLLEDMFIGGVYGHDEKFRQFGQTPFINILFPTPYILAEKYDILFYHKYLYPIFIIVRWFELLFKYASKGNFAKEKFVSVNKRAEILNYYHKDSVKLKDKRKLED